MTRMTDFLLQKHNRKPKREKRRHLQGTQTEERADQEALFRNIEQNVTYRKTTTEIQKLDQEILDLEKQMLVFGEKERSEAEMQRLVKYIQDLSSEQSRCQGTMTVYQNNVAKNKADLKQVQYKDIENRYGGQFIQDPDAVPFNEDGGNK